MRLNRNEVDRVFRIHFPAPAREGVEAWLYDSITGWLQTGQIVSFSPFAELFPSQLAEEEVLAAIGNSLSRQKPRGNTCSPAALFRHALANLLARKDFYLANIDAWRFTLRTAQEMNLSEAAETLTILIGFPEFRKAGNDKGYALFRDVFDAAEAFGPTQQTITFWKACKAHICEYPALSLRLLLKLARAEPEFWADHAVDTRMASALKTYRNRQMEQFGCSAVPEFERAVRQISEGTGDWHYQCGLEKLRQAGMNFLVDADRVTGLSQKRENLKPILSA